MLRRWHGLALSAALVIATGCADDGLLVLRDEVRWDYAEVRSEVRRTGNGLELTIAPFHPGPPGTADADLTLRLVVALASDEMPRRVPIDGAALFAPPDIIRSAREEPSSFEPGPSNDPTVERAFIADLCFCGGPSEVRQEVTGELVLERLDPDGTLHGRVDIEASPLPNTLARRVVFAGPFTARPR